MKTQYTPDWYWESYYNSMEKYLMYNLNNIPFKDLYSKYIEAGETCFEVGCYPGNNLIYFAKEFGYSVSGIDISPRVHNQVPAHLETNGVQAEELICQDFLTFEASKTYDLVFSIGFVEHFWNWEEIIVKHTELVNRGGTLIINCPNLTHLQYLLHRLLNPRVFETHFIEAMYLDRWYRILKENGMKPLYHGYYATAGFVYGAHEQTKPQLKLSRLVARLFRWINKRYFHPNPWISPYIMSISKKY